MNSAVTTTLDQLRRDLRTYAELAEADYRPEVVDPVLASLADAWANSIVGVRTTTHPVPEREVNARVQFPGEPSELVGTLRADGLLDFVGHPIEALLTATMAAAPCRAGVDLAVGTGLQKIWLIFPQVLSVDQVLALPGLPEAVPAYTGHLKRYGGEIGIMAFDFANRTMNLYSQVLPPGTLSSGDVAEMLAELELHPAAPEELAALPSPFNVYRTFSWTSSGMRRICFPMRHTAETFPTGIDPLLARFVEDAPFADSSPGAARRFTFYAAYGPADRYFKVQAEYSNTAHATFPGGVAPAVR
ncbi:aromatic prenyltransferase [Nocardia yamanashiensis]|uniref:aromatic prenyltransferase n=1 Tax=Nocardia yamanashiensis TaxID=209247 RepID=UPI000834FEC9|nr:aromatic prenyltransferase [Nocardia yamanashiensis]